MFTERYSVFKLLLRSGLLNSWVHDHVLVLQELFAVHSSSGDTESSLEPVFTSLQKENGGMRQKELKRRRNIKHTLKRDNYIMVKIIKLKVLLFAMLFGC